MNIRNFFNIRIIISSTHTLCRMLCILMYAFYFLVWEERHSQVFLHISVEVQTELANDLLPFPHVLTINTLLHKGLFIVPKAFM